MLVCQKDGKTAAYGGCFVSGEGNWENRLGDLFFAEYYFTRMEFLLYITYWKRN